MPGNLDRNGEGRRVKKGYLLFILPALVIILLDQVSKGIVANVIPIHGSFAIIRGYFNLSHIQNRGMAFGILNRPGSNMGFYFLVLAAFVAMAVLVFWFLRLKERDRHFILPLSLVFGGALGNQIDRLRLGVVIDFLDFHIGSFSWPAFNVADSAITVGTFWLAVLMLFFPPGKGRKVP